MDVQSDSKTSEETKLYERDVAGKSSTNTKLSEENPRIIAGNSMKGKYIQETDKTSEESRGSENENKTDLNNSHSADGKELLMKSNCEDKNKEPMHGVTPGNVKSQQEKLEAEKQYRSDLNVTNMTQSKSAIWQAKVIKGNSGQRKKICPKKQGNKVRFQTKNKKPDEMENSNKNDSKEANQLSTKKSVDSLASSNESPSNIESASNIESPSNIDTINVQSKHLLDYGFTHLKEEMRTLIQKCVDKEDNIESLEKRLKETNQSYSDTKKKCLHLQQRNEKLSKNLEETTNKLDKTVQDLNSAKAFISEAKQAKKIADSTTSDLEKRLGQTLALNEKMKAKLDTMTLGGKNDQMLSQKKIEEITETNKLLSRQKSELREVVIKQMQLVNNLKRQLLHMKAGMAQKITEQEVAKFIDEFY